MALPFPKMHLVSLCGTSAGIMIVLTTVAVAGKTQQTSSMSFLKQRRSYKTTLMLFLQKLSSCRQGVIVCFFFFSLTNMCQVSAHPDVIITISEFVFSAPTTFHFSSICQEYYPPSHPSHSIHSLILTSLAPLILILSELRRNTNKAEGRRMACWVVNPQIR